MILGVLRTSVNLLRFSSVITMLVLPLLITYLTFLTSDIYDVNYDVRYLYAYIDNWNDAILWTLQRIPELYAVLRCGNPPQTDSFRRSLGDSPENLWKL